MSNKKQDEIKELKQMIAIERLRQAPPSVKISFGMSEGEFMDRDELIENVEKDTEIGNKIVNLQLEYLKAFKKGFLMNN